MNRESLTVDVLIIGAGPAGLSAAIRIMQLSQSQNRPISVTVLEKAAEVGAHNLSGAVLDPKALDELLSDWMHRDSPLKTPVTQDAFLLLTQHRAWHLPTPACMKNQGNYIVSLGIFCRWLAKQAEDLGVNIFPGFSAVQVLYDDTGKVCGVATGDKGLDKSGNLTARYQAGLEIYATHTLFAEGCRGSLTQTLIEKFHLTQQSQPQTYALGIKELWEVAPEQHRPGHVYHFVGWPLDRYTYGGSFLYHLEKNQVVVGFVVGLDYRNPYLDPYEELQQFKTHPTICQTFKGGRRLAYGARSLNEGGWQSIPDLSFPGGTLIGDCAGVLNVSRIKGIHTSMKSGMVAAECLMEKAVHQEIPTFKATMLNTWVGQELYGARNIRPSFYWGLWVGLAYSAIDMYLFGGKAPWTLSHRKADHVSLKPAKNAKKIHYPKHDQVLTFDKLSSVYLSNIHHTENQPCHLVLKNPNQAIAVNYAIYDAPETRYCPAGVYEILSVNILGAHPQLQINAANCLHCKACDIKDPTQNIRWVPPEGGDGPNYEAM